MALTRKQLDVAGCGEPNCGHDHSAIYLHSVCHPKAGTWARYDKPTGLLTIVCSRCKKPVAQVKVAEQ